MAPLDEPSATHKVLEEMLFECIEHGERGYEPITGFGLVAKVAEYASSDLRQEITKTDVSGILWMLIEDGRIDISPHGRLTIAKPAAN